jgi:hypothetical protein
LPADTDAADLAALYERQIAFCCAKAWYKWRGYVWASGHLAAFQYEDIRQLTLEALLLFGGLLPKHGRAAQSGTLAGLEAKGGERYVQRALDLYVSSALLKLVDKSRADMRGGGEVPASLDAVPAGFDGAERQEHYGAVETSPQALTGIALRYPLLAALEIEGDSHEEAAARAGLTSKEFASALKREVAEFAMWARANRRVKAGATPRRNALAPCPYGEPSCSGVHTTSHGRASELCPAVRAKRAKAQNRARTKRLAVSSTEAA